MTTVWFLMFLTMVNGMPIRGSAPFATLTDCMTALQTIKSNPLLSVTDARCMRIEVPTRALLMP